jgi:hypothetical protein
MQSAQELYNLLIADRSELDARGVPFHLSVARERIREAYPNLKAGYEDEMLGSILQKIATGNRTSPNLDVDDLLEKIVEMIARDIRPQR